MVLLRSGRKQIEPQTKSRIKNKNETSIESSCTNNNNVSTEKNKHQNANDATNRFSKIQSKRTVSSDDSNESVINKKSINVTQSAKVVSHKAHGNEIEQSNKMGAERASNEFQHDEENTEKTIRLSIKLLVSKNTIKISSN